MIASGHQGLRERASKLAAAAAALKHETLRVGGPIAQQAGAPFHLAFLTDSRRVPTPEAVMRAAPAGTAVIFRDYDAPARARRARTLAALARARGLIFLVGVGGAGDVDVARAIGADGVHLPSRLLQNGRPWTSRAVAGGVVTAACHGAHELRLAAELGADAAFLSPVFPTASHPGARSLGADSFRALAAASPLPVLALGGVDETNARALAGPGVAGFGAIGGFAAR